MAISSNSMGMIRKMN
uniref:Uncharacterized protein n=1 Tax=Arundo donax TaxID=35708 RepID=A0A0A9B1P0_ARUDO